MSDPLSRLVGELSRLPGVGRKTATRLAHHLLKVPLSEAEALAEAVVDVKKKLFHCSVCNSITAVEPCGFCTGSQGYRSKSCGLGGPFNTQPRERTGQYRGPCHVLLGALSPQRGIGPEDIAIESLLTRLDGVEEVVVATNPDVEGEATALYLARLLRPREIGVTRLAFGMPVGGDIEYTDEVTLGRALSGRVEM